MRSASLTLRYDDPGRARLSGLRPAVGAVKRRTVQWEVPSVLSDRVDSRLLLQDSLSALLSHLVPRFGGTRPSPFLALLVLLRVETSACMFWGAICAPRTGH